jgi:hypothetical protein
MVRWQFLIVGLLAVLAAAAPGRARPPANANPALHAWFESLREPGTNLGCCSESDCHIMASEDVKQTRDGYQIRVRNLWVAVPNDKILQHQRNPSGGTVACYGPGRDAATQANVVVYCFVRGTDA